MGAETIATAEIPIARGAPLVGSLWPMLTDPAGFMLQAYRETGPVFRLHVMNRRFVVIAGTEANLFVTRHEREHLQNGPVFAGFTEELGGHLFLASADGEPHKQLRRIQTPSYSPGQFESRVPEVVESLQRRLGGLRPGAVVDVMRLFQLLVAEQMGLAVHSQPQVAEVLDDALLLFRLAISVRVMHQWPRAVLRWPRYQRARRRVFAYIERVIQFHRDNPSTTRNDLVDDVLAAVARGDTVKEEDLLMIVLGPLGALDTTASTGAFALYNLLTQAELRARVMAEVREVFASASTPDWDRFKGMTALRGVVMETLRLHPSVYLASRHVMKDFEFGGYTVRAGQHLLVATSVPHFLDAHFKNPTAFDIDRYSPERREHTQPGAYAPFGTGVHTCLGARFAQSQLLVTMATLLHHLDLSLSPKDYRLRVKYNPVTMPAALEVKIGDVRLPPSTRAEPWPPFRVAAG